MTYLSILALVMAISACGTVVKNPKGGPQPTASNKSDLTELTSSLFDEIAESMRSPEATLARTTAELGPSKGGPAFRCTPVKGGIRTHFEVATATTQPLTIGDKIWQYQLSDQQVHDHTWTGVGQNGEPSCAPSGRLNATWETAKGLQLNYDFTLDDTARMARAPSEVWYRRSWTASGRRAYAITNVDSTVATVAAEFSFSGTTERASPDGAMAMHVTTPTAFVGKVSRDSATGLALTQTLSSGSLQAAVAQNAVLKMEVRGLLYDLTRFDVCWPVAGIASFALEDADGKTVAWSFDFAKFTAAAPAAIADNGDRAQLEPGFCLNQY